MAWRGEAMPTSATGPGLSHQHPARTRNGTRNYGSLGAERAAPTLPGGVGLETELTPPGLQTFTQPPLTPPWRPQRVILVPESDVHAPLKPSGGVEKDVGFSCLLFVPESLVTILETPTRKPTATTANRAFS